MMVAVFNLSVAGQIISAGLPDIVDSAKSQNAKPYVVGQTHSPETGGYDHYHGKRVTRKTCGLMQWFSSLFSETPRCFTILLQP